jgi:cyclase
MEEYNMANVTNLPTSTYFKLEKINEGIFAAIIQDGTGAWGNAGIIDLGEEILIIDTFLTPQAATELRNISEDLTNKPIKYVVNTHAHFDHTLGNQVFTDAEIISTRRTKEILENGWDFKDVTEISTQLTKHISQLATNIAVERDVDIASSRLWEVREFQKLLESVPEIDLTLPSFTFEKEHFLQGSNRKVELYSYGGGHSPSDAFVYLPEEKILFSGDLVFINNHPSLHTQSPEEWIVILEKINQLDIEHIVSGHGPVGTKEAIDIMVTYFKHVIEISERAIQNDESVETLLARPMSSEYKDWGHLQVYRKNLEKVYKQKLKV